MSMELITIIATIISANIALAGLLISGQNSLRGEMQEQRKEMQEQGTRLGKRISEQGKEIEGVKIEVASLRATVETYFRVRVDPPPTAAVAEPPEDYGVD